MKKIIKFVVGFLVIILLLQISVFAEPQLRYIEQWKDGVACNSHNEAITDCIAYDYLSNNPDRFVKLDTNGKEIARASDPESLANNMENDMGTAELYAIVPDGIENAVELVLWGSNGDSYVITAYKDNNYAARLNIPAGTYSIFSAGIKDDFKGEYPAKCDKSEITVEPLTAVKIEVTVSEKQDLTDPLTYVRKNEENENSVISETLEPTNEPVSSPFTAEAKSLLKSTVITLSVLVLLFICYRIIVWYRNRKNSRRD